MASKTFSIQAEFKPLVMHFPSIERSLLSRVGYSTKELLHKRFLQGQAILLTKKRDLKGRRTNRFHVSKSGHSVKIVSFPMNLFEKGRMLRSGEREEGKKVFKNKLPPLAEKNAQVVSDRYFKNLVRGENEKNRTD